MGNIYEKNADAIKSLKEGKAYNQQIEDVATNVTTKDIKDILVDPRENVLATFGNNYLQTILLNSKAEQFAFILTDKRLYYKGTGFYSPSGGKGVDKARMEYIVDLTDISSTGFTTIGTMSVILLIIGLLTIIVMGLGLLILLFAYLLYVLRRGTYYNVYFNGGHWSANIKLFGYDSANDFNRQVRRAITNAKQKQ